MTATLQDYDVVVDDATAVEPTPKLPAVWLWIAGATTAVLLAIGILFTAVPSLHENVVAGTATANVAAAADARKDQAEADQKAADAAYLQSLEVQVKQDMQKVMDAKDIPIPITVLDVGLIKVGPNKYEGMATMQAAGYPSHQIAIHVTADTQNIMWGTDPGALYVLFS